MLEQERSCDEEDHDRHPLVKQMEEDGMVRLGSEIEE